jgi:glucose-6-phosphate isomerase
MKFTNAAAEITFENSSEQEEHVLNYVHLLKPHSGSFNYNHSEDFLNLPFDKELLEKSNALKQKYVTPNLKYVVVIGIGGSNLGTKAIYDAIHGSFDNLTPNRFPKMLFVDTVNPKTVEKAVQLVKTLKEEEFLVNVITKSGTTLESITNTEVFLNTVPNVAKRMVITTREDVQMWQWAQEAGIDTLAIPKKVGGRFSVFSAVGIFPLACAGIDVDKLRNGATKITEMCLSEKLEENDAVKSALTIFEHLESERKIHNTFFFNTELESLGKWYLQLVGESLGKQEKGITPTYSLGTNDLHSLVQLYFGGPKDKLFTFVTGTSKTTAKMHAATETTTKILPQVANKSASDVIKTIYEGVKQTYRDEQLPYMEIDLGEINEESLGEFMQFKMAEIIYLARLMHVDAFDQPDVEKYKSKVREMMETAIW